MVSATPDSAAEENRGADPKCLFRNTLPLSRLDRILCGRKVGCLDHNSHALNTLRKMLRFFPPAGVGTEIRGHLPSALPRARAAAVAAEKPCLARSIVTEAFGRVTELVLGGRVFEIGGWFGSGWLFGPSDFHMYCSLPKVVMVIGPARAVPDVPAPSKASFMSCGLDWSLLMIITDHWPSGRETA